MTADRLPKMRQTQRRMVTPDVYGRRVPNRSPWVSEERRHFR